MSELFPRVVLKSCEPEPGQIKSAISEGPSPKSCGVELANPEQFILQQLKSFILVVLLNLEYFLPKPALVKDYLNLKCDTEEIPSPENNQENRRKRKSGITGRTYAFETSVDSDPLLPTENDDNDVPFWEEPASPNSASRRMRKVSKIGPRTSREILVAPEPEQANLLPFPCYMCEQSFDTEVERGAHLATQSCYNRKYQKLDFRCDEHHDQGETFENASKLLAHYYRFHRYFPISQCCICKWPFLDNYKRELHELVHTNRVKVCGKQRLSERTVLRCPECEKYFPRVLELQGHYNIQHGRNIVLHKCSECAKDFRSFYQLTKHMRGKHVEQVNSQVITERETSQQGTSQSPKNVHVDLDMNDAEKSWLELEIEPGGNSLEMKMDVEEVSGGSHEPKIISTHTIVVQPTLPVLPHPSTLKIFPCYLCYRVFMTEKGRSQHIHKYHDSDDLRFNCDVDNLVFWKVDHLRTHIQIHHPDTPIHQCSACEWCFLDETKRDLHEIVHRPPNVHKKFPCSKCEFASTDVRELQSHHNNEHSDRKLPIFNCSKCEKPFSVFFRLRNHLKYDHKDGEESSFSKSRLSSLKLKQANSPKNLSPVNESLSINMDCDESQVVINTMKYDTDDPLM